MNLCKTCGTICPFDDERTECDAYAPMTNENWFISLPTEEKAKFLREMVYYGCLYDEWEQQSITENVPTEVIIVEWLKQPHNKE